MPSYDGGDEGLYAGRYEIACCSLHSALQARQPLAQPAAFGLRFSRGAPQFHERRVGKFLRLCGQSRVSELAFDLFHQANHTCGQLGIVGMLRGGDRRVVAESPEAYSVTDAADVDVDSLCPLCLGRRKRQPITSDAGLL